MALLIQFKEASLKKGSWTVEEDNKLISYVRNHGIWNWNEMPKAAGLARTGKSCRLRWMNYLRPNLKHGNFTKKEDETILKLHRRHGNRWATIAAKLHGRSDNEIKNHFHTRLRKIAEKRVVRSLHRSSSGQASSPATGSSSSSYSSSPDSINFINSRTDRHEIVGTCESEEQKVRGYFYGVDQLQLSVERMCLREDNEVICDYESYWFEEYFFNLQNAANTVLDDTDNDLWFDLFDHGTSVV